MREGSTDQHAYGAAQAILECFGSIGATCFDVTLTTRTGNKDSFQRNVSPADLAPACPAGSPPRRNASAT
jgi:hypothetical protein